jgi:hypothetical protein
VCSSDLSAFKNYDIILSNGEYQFKELRLAEEQFNFPKKEVVNSGYFFLDNINKSFKRGMSVLLFLKVIRSKNFDRPKRDGLRGVKTSFKNYLQ